MKKSLILISLALLAACTSPKIADPTIDRPSPPPTLMEAPLEMETIKEEP